MIDHHQGWRAHTTHDADLVTIISDDDDQRLVEHCATGAMEWVPRGDVHPDAPFRTESAWGGQELRTPRHDP